MPEAFFSYPESVPEIEEIAGLDIERLAEPEYHVEGHPHVPKLDGADVAPVYVDHLGELELGQLFLFPVVHHVHLKTISKSHSINIPINQLDNVEIIEELGDRSYRTKTLGIRSARGLIKFPYVANADEFSRVAMDKAKIGSVPVVVAAAPAPAPAQPQDMQARFQELKKLLDSGMISQEEFDAKRQDFLNKM